LQALGKHVKFPALLVSDLHLTANPADEYRWALFPWLWHQLVINKCRTLFIGGDITDAKDYHGAELVNRLTRAMVQTASHVEQIIINRGNHDYLREGHTFFEFLNLWPNIRYFTKPADLSAEGESVLLLPYSKNPAQDWAALSLADYQYLFMHQTLAGSVSSNGQRMEGDLMPELHRVGKIWSGDIHVPQVIGPVEYIGSPYPVHFGDSFRGRAVLLDADGKPSNLRFPSIRRMALKVDSLDAIVAQRLSAKDQVKIELTMTAAEAHEWKAIKRAIIEHVASTGAELHGLSLAIKADRKRVDAVKHGQAARTPRGTVLAYVEAEDLGANALQVGLELLE